MKVKQAADASRPNLSYRAVAHEVLSVYQRHWKFLIPAAMLILLPETLPAVRAAQRDRMQISLNLASDPRWRVSD